MSELQLFFMALTMSIFVPGITAAIALKDSEYMRMGKDERDDT